MTKQEQINLIKQAIAYSTKEKAAENMLKAIACFAELNGWTKDNSTAEFIDLCLERAEIYKSSHSYMIKDSNDASNIALYIDNQAGKDIIDQRNNTK